MSEVLGPYHIDKPDGSECHRSLMFNYEKAFLFLVKELSAIGKEILQRQSGISYNEDAEICSYHKAVLLTKFEFLQKDSCNPFGKESYKAREGLWSIYIDSTDRLKALTQIKASSLFDIKPGQKLCP
ncbi:ARL14 effector protein-like [Lycorma delicatula]|uniref:ARL14 effector protein-like n=1 Tax=Lycorma delicatula TaxID=130591 RepID=UPI003F511904